MASWVEVLHVDDDSDFLAVSEAALARADETLDVTTATGVENALDQLESETFDCIVSDYDMPAMTGIEFLEHVRSEYGDLPFILFTGKGSEEVASDAFAAGATDYIQKKGRTSQYTVLANRIDNAVSKYRAQQRSEAEHRRRKQMLDRFLDGYVAFDEQLRFTEVNESAAAFLELSPEEVVGKRYQDVTIEAGDDAFLDAYEEILETGTPQTVEAKSGIHPDRWVEARIFPTEDGLSVYFRDITERKRYERELEASRTRLRAQFENAPDGIVIHDIDGTVLDVNETLVDMLGYDRDELTAMHVAEFDAQFARAELQEMWATLDDDELITAESEHRCADGSTLPVEVWVGKIDLDGETRFLAHVRDISERKESKSKLEQERSRFSNLFEKFPEPTIEYQYEDDEPIVRAVNEAFAETFGYDRETAVGKSVDDLVVPPEKRDEAQDIDRRVQAGEQVDTELKRETVDGDRYFNFRNIAVDGAENIDGYAVYADIHEQRERELELQRQNERLEQFTRIVSHDLRNPLNVAKSRLTLARDECDSEHLDAVFDAHDRIETIVEETLVLARQGDTVDEMESVSLEQFTHECWQGVQTGDADVVVEDDTSVAADPDRLRHVFENLLDNAVEHGSTSPDSQAQQDAVEHGSTGNQTQSDDAVEHGSTSPDSHITVRVGTLDDRDGFYVADDGSGIPGEVADDLFEFGVSTADDGTGFGLPIVEQVATAHDWDVTVTESVDGGARFEIET